MHKQWYSVHTILLKKSEQENENMTYSSPQSTLQPGLVISASDVIDKEDA